MFYEGCFETLNTIRDVDETTLLDVLSHAAVTGVGGSVYSATVPAITVASCTRSQRSIESKSMESFFGARSDIHNKLLLITL